MYLKTIAKDWGVVLGKSVSEDQVRIMLKLAEVNELDARVNKSPKVVKKFVKLSDKKSEHTPIKKNTKRHLLEEFKKVYGCLWTNYRKDVRKLFIDYLNQHDIPYTVAAESVGIDPSTISHYKRHNLTRISENEEERHRKSRSFDTTVTEKEKTRRNNVINIFTEKYGNSWHNLTKKERQSYFNLCELNNVPYYWGSKVLGCNNSSMYKYKKKYKM